jgi:dipeptidyl-peptidase-4
MKLTSSQTLTLGAVLLQVAVAIEPPREPHQPTGNGDRILTWNETMVDGGFGASSISVSWVSGDEDGQYIYQADDGALILENFVTGENETFVAAGSIPEDTHDYFIRGDLQRVLFATNYTPQYRHSYFADYFILDVATGVLTPLVEDQVGDIQYAELAPAGDTVAFVRGNNLYLSKNGTISQITDDGGPDLFHGVPDWVYEEEIFGGRSTLWFSPDGEAIAYLSFDETGVETFTVQYFMDNQDIAPVYPRELDLRYPKVGTTNPTVSLTVLIVETEETIPVPVDAYEPTDLIIGEVAWVTAEHSSVIYRAFNRVQDQSKHVRVDIGETVTSQLIRERDGTDGWLDNNLGIQYIGDVDGTEYYLDISDESGWQHIYLYPVDGSEGIAITEGEWEVTSIRTIDTERQLIYYLSTQAHSTERHLYSVSYVTRETTALVDDTVPAYWSASFSSGAGYYILTYQGPDVPYQELYSINDTATPIRVISSNEELWNRLQEYNLPNTTYFELEHPDGYTLNVAESLPPNFDPSRTYPVLFTPYGGPASQEVNKAYITPAWSHYLNSDPELEYITYTVDNRGTGYKGREFRSLVASHLGDFEAVDQVWAAEELIAQNAYIDSAHVGIFGWSYGGYLSAKVVELDSGVFTLGLIVAPVTDWRFYDSMYTERYMKTSQQNPEGYNGTAVRRVDGFRNIAGGVTIQHGLGDDNVHYQNTAALLDLLVGSGVHPSKLDWRTYTDSNHRISYNGAYLHLHRHLTGLLYNEKLRTGEDLRHQWSRRFAALFG